MMKLRNKKTGEVSDVILVDSGFICKDVWRGDIGRYKTLAELNEEWEDYKPAEPLIKDEKIRKAILAWAEASDVGVARVAPFGVFDIETSASIYFYSRVIEDKDYDEEKSYTITELCGEEKKDDGR